MSIKSKVTSDADNVIPSILEKDVIIGFDLLQFSSSINMNIKDNYLPPGGSYVLSKTAHKVIDISKGAGGKYIYLTKITKKIYELLPSQKLVNYIKVQVGNNNCGNFTVLNKDFNRGAGGEYIYLCYGSDNTGKKPLAPIEHMYIRQRESAIQSEQDKFIPQGSKDYVQSICDLTNLNKGAGGTYSYICYTRNNALPKKLEITNLAFDYAGKTLVEGQSEAYKTDVFNVSNGNGGSGLAVSLTRSVAKSTVESSTKTLSAEYTASWGTSASAGIGIFEATASVNMSVTASMSFSSGKSSSTTTTNSNEMSCEGYAGKYERCSKVTKTGNYNIPYVYEKVYTDYDGKITRYPKNGKLNSFQSSETNLEKCCYAFCKTGDNLCDGSVISPTYSYCPYKAPSVKKITVDPLEIGLGEFDGDALADIKWIYGDKGASCPGKFLKVGDKSDIRLDLGGDYLYLCKRIKKLSDFSETERPINYISVTRASDCNDFQMAINKSGSSDIMNGKYDQSRIICYGYDKTLKDGGTIVDIKYISNSNKTYQGWTKVPYSMTSQNSDGVYLYYQRSTTLASKIKLVNWSFGNFRADDIALPKTLDVITTNGMSLTKTIEYSESETTSFAFNLNVGFSVEVSSEASADVGVGSVSASASRGFSVNAALDTSTENTTETTRSSSVTCVAQEGKKVRCTVAQSQQDFLSDYTVVQQFLDYKDKVLGTQKINGTIYSKGSSMISVSSCCVANCCVTAEDYVKHDFCWVRKLTGDRYTGESGKRPVDIPCEKVDKCIKDQIETAKVQTPQSKTIKSTVSKLTKFR